MKRTTFLVLILCVSLSAIRSQVTNGNYPENKEITSVLRKYTDANELAGIITVIADKDRILSLNCAGVQNTETGKEMNENTLFWMASQSKPVTGVAVMMIVEDGLADLDEPVGTYLPELRNLYTEETSGDMQVTRRPVTKPVTLRHLLSHTSGMKWVAGIQEKMGNIDILPFRVSAYASALTPLEFEPGEKYLYSNQGINIAATVVERVTGKRFEEFLEERLFGPLGMCNTTFWPTDRQLENFAPPHEKKNGRLVPSLLGQLQYPLQDKENRYPEAAGGLFSTPTDLVRFYQMMVNKGEFQGKRFLSEKSFHEIWRRQTPEKPGMDSYGLGWSVNQDLMGHGGACGTDSKIYPKTGYVLMYIVQENGLDINQKAQQDFWETASRIYDYQSK